MTDAATGAGRRLISFYQVPPKKSLNSLGVELLPIDQADGFALPGPAVVGIVYVRHPIDAHELIPFADYDEKLAQDRYNEALRVFTKLGAARIVATSRRQTTKQVAGRLGIKRLGADLGAGKDATWSLTFDQEGKGGVPLDPRPLRFRDEPMLDAVCDGVLHLGVKKGRIQITRSSTLGVDGELGLRLRKAGFKLGVSGTKATVTEFVIEAAFTADAAKELDAVVAKTEPTPIPARRSLLRRNLARGG
ncbi:hypothetical protein ISU10_02410 [Nocardioides agariphilus]|uniref:Uncharacterized protein n=1 Tax=Nocardioides agariphilus TaxID=433664 RepID=A0A930YH50_9ACTN|nr:hypothetical protein [Nocardioides agariphilus]MBF4766618.1 hypothetical protein [Nocardioides agariphilus]